MIIKATKTKAINPESTVSECTSPAFLLTALMSKNLLAAVRARLESLRVRGDAQYVHVQQSSCVQSSAAAAATGAFTGSLGRNTCEERDTRARPRAAADRGACWEGAGPSPCQGGGGVTVKQKETTIRRVSSSGALRPSRRHPRTQRVPPRAAAVCASGS